MNHTESKKILVVAAHPDDETLGCGGTIAQFAKNGHGVYCLILNKGKSSRYEGSEKENPSLKKEQEALVKETRRAMSALGVKEVFFGDFPDQKYDTVPLLEITKFIEKIREEVKPDIVFTHYKGDLNNDHATTAKAVMVACRPIQQNPVKEIYSFEILSSTEWTIENAFMPTVFFDIKETLPIKLEALASYESELRPYPHPRSLKGVEILAHYRGITMGKESVEAFEVMRILR